MCSYSKIGSASKTYLFYTCPNYSLSILLISAAAKSLHKISTFLLISDVKFMILKFSRFIVRFFLFLLSFPHSFSSALSHLPSPNSECVTVLEQLSKCYRSGWLCITDPSSATSCGRFRWLSYGPGSLWQPTPNGVQHLKIVPAKAVLACGVVKGRPCPFFAAALFSLYSYSCTFIPTICLADICVWRSAFFSLFFLNPNTSKDLYLSFCFKISLFTIFCLCICFARLVLDFPHLSRT